MELTHKVDIFAINGEYLYIKVNGNMEHMARSIEEAEDWLRERFDGE